MPNPCRRGWKSACGSDAFTFIVTLCWANSATVAGITTDKATRLFLPIFRGTSEVKFERKLNLPGSVRGASHSSGRCAVDVGDGASNTGVFVRLKNFARN